MAGVAQYEEWGWRQMEELLQCPICFELPMGPVPLCMQGHHICSECRQKIHQCPLCKSIYSPTEARNYVVEELVANFATLKNIMTLKNILSTPLDSKSESMKKSKSCLDVMLTPKPTKPHLPAPVQSRGEYPCAICTGKYPVSRMLVHLQYFHKDDLLEVPSEVQPSQVNVSIRYKTSSSRTLALQFKNLGVFFLNAECNVQGQIKLFLRMVASHSDAQKYNYALKIPNETPNFLGRGMSCREPLHQMSHRSQCLVLEPQFMRSMMRTKREKIFTVCITVTRSVQDDHNVPSTSNSNS